MEENLGIYAMYCFPSLPLDAVTLAGDTDLLALYDLINDDTTCTLHLNNTQKGGVGMAAIENDQICKSFGANCARHTLVFRVGRSRSGIVNTVANQ
eukprot:scaffold1778_cov101-Cylindrotheca_fusiformis.AAC.3